MAMTQFNKPILRSNRELVVSGPFDPEGVPMIGEATIRFLLVQDGTPQTQGGPSIVVDGVGRWTSGPDWTGTVTPSRVPGELRASPRPDSPGKEGLCRGIATAIWIRPAASDDEEPTFESLTWCVTTEIVAED
jgi:hypothetical protein